MSQAAGERVDHVVARSGIGTAFYLFGHQAGGHKPFLRSACGKVCKPAIPLELQFYQALEMRFPQLKDFVPPFLGVITVDLHPISGPACATKEPPPLNLNEIAGRESDADNSADDGATANALATDALQIRSMPEQKPTATTTLTDLATKKDTLFDKHASLDVPLSSSPSEPTRSFISTASYSAKLWRKERSEALASSRPDGGPNKSPRYAFDANLSREYLVLGDLTKYYSRPCVLDIKMGTRQHGEDASPEKVMSHSAKCASTTSLALGLRVCGMQIYDEVEQRYVLWDKHWGRQLQAKDIESALVTYLSNGTGLHLESLQVLLSKLQALQSVIECTAGVRFWGSSLLLIYEGDFRNAARREDVHLIDFAHCQMSDALDAPDDGLLLGLTNLISFLASISDSNRRTVNEIK